MKLKAFEIIMREDNTIRNIPKARDSVSLWSFCANKENTVPVTVAGIARRSALFQSMSLFFACMTQETMLIGTNAIRFIAAALM